MRKKEQKLWDAMRKNKGAAIFLERYEDMLGSGPPDVNALSNGLVTRIELKAVYNYPKRVSTRVFGDKGLNQDQKNWHLMWNRHGGRSLIIASVGEEERRIFYCVNGKHGDHFNGFTKGDLARFAMAVDLGPKFWPWVNYFLTTEWPE